MKAMRVAALYLAAGLVGGFALSALLIDEGTDTSVASPGNEPSFELRMTRLESRLESVIVENAQLREAIQRLETIARETVPVTQFDADDHRVSFSSTQAENVPAGESQAQSRQRFGQARLRGAENDIAERLSEAGFTPAAAQHLETRIEELRVAAMQSRYEALRNGEPQSALDQIRSGSEALRAELGDAEYERFLEATGRPTRVGVSTVLASSAAQTAGMQPGDQILAYGGQRVFDIRELNQVLLAGEPGEPVVVDIERDGQPIQLVIPRGPLGISAGYRGRGAR